MTIPNQSDLERFVALYKSFGIECIVNKEHELGNAFISFVEPNPHQEEGIDTVTDCCVGINRIRKYGRFNGIKHYLV